MTMRQISDTTTDSDDLLAMPGGTAAVFRRLSAEREELIAARTTTAHARHEHRCTEHRAALMSGAMLVAPYREAVAESAAQRDEEIAHQPPALDLELSRARVEARALEAMAGWWADEMARAQAAQQAWAAANADSAAEASADADTDADTDAEGEQGTVDD